MGLRELDGFAGVLVDIDNTLYAYEPAHAAALEACAILFAEKFGDRGVPFGQLYREARNIVKERLLPQAACRSRLLGFLELFERQGEAGAYSLALVFDTLYWDTFLDHVVPHAEVVGFLQDCHKRGMPICALTNMLMAEQVRKLERLGLADVVTLLVTSEEVGEEKPSMKMFERGLSKLELPAEKVLMVGDDEACDMVPARALGMQAHLVVI